jgi:ribonuclease T1
MKVLRRSGATIGLAAFLLLTILLAVVEPAQARPSGEEEPAVIRVEELPREARETLALIRQGGPFPYRKDGIVFGNRERRLPARSSGYYREYTVPTPDARDRGARRIIAGGSGEYYYTGDHYNTFRRIRE